MNYKVQIDLGCEGWRHPEIESWWFGGEERAKNEAIERGLDPELVKYVDTVPSVEWVLAEVVKRERAWWLANKGEEQKWSIGPWNENGPHLFDQISDWKATDKWPTKYQWISCYVVRGGSEGLWLHVDLLFSGEGRSKDRIAKWMFIAKTLDTSTEHWEECWASAGRIANYLGA